MQLLVSNCGQTELNAVADGPALYTYKLHYMCAVGFATSVRLATDFLSVILSAQVTG